LGSIKEILLSPVFISLVISYPPLEILYPTEKLNWIRKTTHQTLGFLIEGYGIY
jgi:hypothetical protein